MKQIITACLIVLLLSGCSTSREIHNEVSTFQLKKIKVERIENIEAKNNGIQDYDNPPTSQGYYPDLNEKFKLKQPIFYHRRQGSLNSEVSYYYSTKDDVVRLISYSWDRVKNSDSIQTIYKQNEHLFKEYFQTEGVLQNVKELTYWQNKITWENKKIIVFQFILGNEKGAYRTRTIIRWK